VRVPGPVAGGRALPRTVPQAHTLKR